MEERRSAAGFENASTAYRITGTLPAALYAAQVERLGATIGRHCRFVGRRKGSARAMALAFSF
jgi:hypothetical protein